MSLENAKKFVSKTMKDQTLRSQLTDLYQKGRKKEIEVLANKANCQCTFPEIVTALKQAKISKGELTDRELQLISGGEDKPPPPPPTPGK